MTNLVSYFRKTDATTLLETHFKPLTVSPNFAQVSFLHQLTESDCGGDDVAEQPFACILVDHESGHSVLFSRPEDNQIVFHGFFVAFLNPSLIGFLGSYIYFSKKLPAALIKSIEHLKFLRNF